MAFCGFERRAFGAAILAAGLLLGCEVKRVPNTPATAEAPASTEGTPEVGSSPKKLDVQISESKEKVSETVTAEGSSTVYPICQLFAVEFEKTSHHKVSVGRQGTGGGYKKFVNRQADIWNASRPIDLKDVDELKSKGIDWLEFAIAVDGIVIAVHPQNTWCSDLTCAQLKRIWEPESQVQTWKDLDPTWPAEPILLFGADTDSGTFEYFTEVINGKKKASNTNYTPASDDNILVTGIAANKFALGYIPYGYYVENTEKLKALNISPTKEATETPAPFVTPTEDTILSQAYAPLSRPLFMYVNKGALLERHEVAEFLAYAVSEAAQPLIQHRGFVRVKDEVRQQMQKKLEAVLTESSASKN